MKAIIGGFTTDIKISKDELIEHCKPGCGADTCSWVLVGANGFDCSYYNRHLALIQRRKSGTMVAMRDGCDKVKSFNPTEYDIGEEIEF